MSKTVGYILNGKYYRQEADISKLRSSRGSMAKAWDHDMQRLDHKRDLIQPWNKDGTLNPEFKQEYPEEAKTYEQGNSQS